ncbi:MAG: sulfur oxidation c-type cytochrome SoxX [Chromatiales bacterium]|nr:sulfur oxidation c-type cytochrome SoxX [Chromatiales bacterium]
MRKSALHLKASAVAIALAATLAPSLGFAEGAAEEGKKLATDRKIGNCLACHMMGDGESPGDIGPPLVAMQARFPDKAKLRDMVWDMTKYYPDTLMPAFGKYGAMSEDQIDKVVEYIYTL